MIRYVVALQALTFVVLAGLLWNEQPRLAAAQGLLAIITVLLYA